MSVFADKLTLISQQLLDKATGAEQPVIYAQPQGALYNILMQLPQLNQKYRPTPWLSSTHLHLLYFDLIKKRRIRQQYERIDQLPMQDGGVTAIAWLGLDLPEDTPTIVMLHTITGTPESMRELVRDLHQYTGWRIALCLRRGHAKLPMPVAQMNLFGSVADLREQLAYVQEKLPQSELYAVGSSAGTGLLVRYLGEAGSDTPFKAAFALCPGYDTAAGFQNVHPFYSKMMTQKLFQNFIEPYRQMWESTVSLEKVMKVKTLQQFEKVYFEMAGYSSYEEYDQATNPIYVFDNIKIPLLILNAEDDPVCHIKNLEPYKATIQNMPNIAVVTTKKGSHCGFYEGVWETHSWAAKLMADFLKQYTA
ncbi:YheT family hydrolase [Acinetobacter tianfuensis]|uniref:Alpha/beta fold hydrolase n=1 Tax=Acinetobacter tianfuensis TaxID=2419603 RepID=A0A3A8EYP0_9GAMM|nr:alpha/beta fold hydrolase [Acinetobacter tianfuensis]RKG33981.1 alpha/beta fold hydrolase [Acinetobacter tianfuensis]